MRPHFDPSDPSGMSLWPTPQKSSGCTISSEEIIMMPAKSFRLQVSDVLTDMIDRGGEYAQCAVSKEGWAIAISGTDTKVLEAIKAALPNHLDNGRD